MPIPTYEEIMRPLLELASDGAVHEFRATVDAMASHFHLSPQEKAELLPSGIYPLFDNRVGWARTYLVKATALESLRKGFFKIGPRGQDLLKDLVTQKIEVITRSWLIGWSPEVRSWIQRSSGSARDSGGTQTAPPQMPTVTHGGPPSATVGPAPTLTLGPDTKTPLERLVQAYSELREKTHAGLVEEMKKLDDRQFEIFIARLLPKLGYGTDARDILRAHGGKGDGGIDGIVQLDALGAERIVIQAKHWAAPVDLLPVAEFEERVRESGVKAGLFVALTGFDKNATTFANKHSDNIAWVNADRLADVMISKGIGIIRDGSFDVWRVDDEFFEVEAE